MPHVPEPDDEHQPPDHERRGDDQDARLAQRLAEEAQHAQAPTRRARSSPAEAAADLARVDGRAIRGRQAPDESRLAHLITRMFGMRGEQHLREHVVERAEPQERDHDRLVDRPAHALGAAGGGHALVAADDRDDRPEASSSSAPSPTGRWTRRWRTASPRTGPAADALTIAARMPPKRPNRIA